MAWHGISRRPSPTTHRPPQPAHRRPSPVLQGVTARDSVFGENVYVGRGTQLEEVLLLGNAAYTSDALRQDALARGERVYGVGEWQGQGGERGGCDGGWGFDCFGVGRGRGAGVGTWVEHRVESRWRSGEGLPGAEGRSCCPGHTWNATHPNHSPIPLAPCACTGANCHIRRCVVDENTTIGDNVKILNKEGVQEADRAEKGALLRAALRHAYVAGAGSWHAVLCPICCTAKSTRCLLSAPALKFTPHACVDARTHLPPPSLPSFPTAEGYMINNGIVVVMRGATIPDGTVI